MGMQQAVREGKWINRPKTGYDLIDGELVPNGDAPAIRKIFRLRAEGLSSQQIEDRTGIKYSTVGAILKSRIYLGEVLLNGEWYPGHHEAIITAEEFAAAKRPHVPGRRRGSDLLSGRVFCGLCGRRMAIEINGDKRAMYRCRHRGKGCGQPRRSTKGLHRAALVGMRLIAEDEKLNTAIRQELSSRESNSPTRKLVELADRRRKLLELHYADRISAELFSEEERSITLQIESAREEVSGIVKQDADLDELASRFEKVAATLRDLDVDRVWSEATDSEKRVLVEELVEKIAIFPDHLEVTIAGAPRLNVTLSEVGLSAAQSENLSVGGGT
jgi:hypothetical protein